MLPTRVTDQRPDGQGEPLHYRIFVLHHTHWDREWWSTFQDFRLRLVELIDDLLATLARDDTFRNFLLDSQTIVLRDYLEIRPENRAPLVRYIREGRIQCGPWYILPDEFLVSGEAHVRNLWLGRRVARDLDCPILDVGYIPDTFGHIAQLPQILRGFGIDNAFVWRGRGGDPATVKQEFHWESPDGSAVLAHWFPSGYYWMPFLHFGNPDRPDEDKLGRIHRSIEEWAPRATTDVLLMPYGGDHRPIDPNLAAKIDAVNREIGDLGEIRWATSAEYVAAIRERNPRLETVRGELRTFGSANPHVLPGVLSTRLGLKGLNFRGQTWLERYAEPLSALAWMQGRRYDAGLLWKAWEYLVQNHPHDSICGCSIDQVHREMIPRFDASRQIARAVAEQSAQYLNARIDTSSFAPEDRALVVHNPLHRTRTAWAAVWIDRHALAGGTIDPHTHRLLDSDGEEVPFQVRDVEGMQPLAEWWRHVEIGFIARAVPGLGYRTYRLTRREIPRDRKQVFFTALQPTAMLKGSEAVTDLALGGNVLQNRYLRVEVNTRDGTLTVTDRSSGEIYGGLNAFEDGGDAGDSYSYSAPLNDMRLRSTDSARVHVSVTEAGYARATLRVDLDWRLPVELSADRLSRSSSYVDTTISTFITLAAESRQVEITTEWENRSKDHRLRALFPLGQDVRVSHAQGQFDVTERPVAADTGNGWPELPVSTMPQQGWVAAGEGHRGLLIANRGLPEYEVLADGRGAVALTLLRAVGWVSRDDTLARIGGAGPETPAPDAQSIGLNRVSYAVIPYADGWLQSRAYLTAEEYLVPFYGSLTGVHPGTVARSGGLVELSGDHTLVLSACKKAEDGDALILRCWNVARTPTRARVRVGRRPAMVRPVDLREEPIGDAGIPLDQDGSFTLEAGPAQIVTVALSYPAGGEEAV